MNSTPTDNGHDFLLKFQTYVPLCYALRGSPMTLHIIGIDKDPDQAREQFWTSAGDILIDLANIQSHIGQTVDGHCGG